MNSHKISIIIPYFQTEGGILKKSVLSVPGVNTAEFDISLFPEGIYFFRLKSPGIAIISSATVAATIIKEIHPP